MSQKLENKFEPIVVTNSSRVLQDGFTFTGRMTPVIPYTEVPNTAIWKDPVSGWIHKEENIENVSNDVPMQTKRILNVYEESEAKQFKQSGNGDYNGNGGWSDEFYPKALLIDQEHNAAKKVGSNKSIFEIMDGLRQSGKITSDDYSEVKSAVLASKVMGISPIGHVLSQLVTTNRVNRIDQKYYKFNAPDNQIQDMGYYNIPEGTVGQYETDTAKIAPYGYTWGVTEDYFMQPYDVNPLSDLTSLLASRLSLFENKKISAALNALPADTGGASLTAKSAEGIFTNNGYDLIFDKIQTIGELERANPTTIISQRKTLVDYIKNQRAEFQNTFDVTGPSPMFAGVVSGVPNLSGMRWGFDNLITLDDLHIIDPEWFIWNVGPDRLSTVINNLTNVRQTLYKKWASFKIVTFGITTANLQESFRKTDSWA